MSATVLMLFNLRSGPMAELRDIDPDPVVEPRDEMAPRPDGPEERRGESPSAAANRAIDSASICVDGVGYRYLAVPQLAPVLPKGLTDVERDVARLASLGFGSREIAEARGVSRRTVENQLANVFRKLGVSSRNELCALVFSGCE